MKVTYNFRTEKQKLPEPKMLFEAVRNLHDEFLANPVKFATKYESWLRPMNQLYQGHFFSLNFDAPHFPFDTSYNAKSNLKLEMRAIDKNYIRITFSTDNSFPYRITPEKY